MRASFKPFLLGIIFTSITWAIILYCFMSFDHPLNSAVKFTASTLQNRLPVNVINSFLNENSKKENDHIDLKDKQLKSASVKATETELESDLGLVRNTEDQKIREDGYSKHAFNVLVSSRLGYHRIIPDSRHKL